MRSKYFWHDAKLAAIQDLLDGGCVNVGHLIPRWRERIREPDDCQEGKSRYECSAASMSLLFLEFDFQHFAFELLAIEIGDGLARFMTFHFQKSKSFTLTREQILGQIDRTHGSHRTEELGQ